MSKYARRVDNNQKRVTGELRNLGFSVALTHTVGKGFPDFVVGLNNVNYLVELKSANGKLTTGETEFHRTYKGQASLHYSTQDILNGFLEYICYLDGLRSPSYLQMMLGEIIRRYNVR